MRLLPHKKILGVWHLFCETFLLRPEEFPVLAVFNQRNLNSVNGNFKRNNAINDILPEIISKLFVVNDSIKFINPG